MRRFTATLYAVLTAGAVCAPLANAQTATTQSADASWCRSAGLSAIDKRGCVARMNTAATDQQRADIQSTYLGRTGAGGATRSAGGVTALDSSLDSGLGLGAGKTVGPPQ